MDHVPGRDPNVWADRNLQFGLHRLRTIWLRWFGSGSTRTAPERPETLLTICAFAGNMRTCVCSHRLGNGKVSGRSLEKRWPQFTDSGSDSLSVGLRASRRLGWAR